MFGQFEKNTPVAYIICLILLIGIGYKIAIIDYSLCPVETMPVLARVFGATESQALIKIIVFFIFVIIISNIYSVNNHKDVSLRHPLLPIYFLLIHLLFTLFFRISLTEVLTMLFLSILYLKFYTIHKGQETTSHFFAIGAMYICTVIIAPGASVALLAILLSISVFGKNGIRDLLGLIVGMLTPVYFWISFLYITNDLASLDRYLHSFYTWKFLWPVGAEYLVIGAAILYFILAQPYVTKFNIHSRKLLTINNLLAICFILFAVFYTYGNQKPMLILAFLSSYYLAVFVVHLRNKRMRQIILYLSFILVSITTIFL